MTYCTSDITFLWRRIRTVEQFMCKQILYPFHFNRSSFVAACYCGAAALWWVCGWELVSLELYCCSLSNQFPLHGARLVFQPPLVWMQHHEMHSPLFSFVGNPFVWGLVSQHSRATCFQEEIINKGMFIFVYRRTLIKSSKEPGFFFNMGLYNMYRVLYFSGFICDHIWWFSTKFQGRI